MQTQTCAQIGTCACAVLTCAYDVPANERGCGKKRQSLQIAHSLHVHVFANNARARRLNIYAVCRRRWLTPHGRWRNNTFVPICQVVLQVVRGFWRTFSMRNVAPSDEHPLFGKWQYLYIFWFYSFTQLLTSLILIYIDFIRDSIHPVLQNVLPISSI